MNFKKYTQNNVYKRFTYIKSINVLKVKFNQNASLTEMNRRLIFPSSC